MEYNVHVSAFAFKHCLEVDRTKWVQMYLINVSHVSVVSQPSSARM